MNIQIQSYLHLITFEDINVQKVKNRNEKDINANSCGTRNCIE